MRRSPQEVVDTLAYSLKEGKPGDEYKVSDLVKKTHMNHVTISSYLDLIMHVQNNLPMIEVVQKKRNSFVKILKEVALQMSDEECTLLSLFDNGAFTKATAVPFFESSRDTLKKLKEASLSSEMSKKVFLLPNGIVKAAELADRRAELTLSPQKQKIFDSGEFKIEEWKNTGEEMAMTEAGDTQEYFHKIQGVQAYSVCPTAI